MCNTESMYTKYVKHLHYIYLLRTGSVTSTDSGLGFYDPRLNATGQRLHTHHHHHPQVSSQHGKTISANGKLISVTGSSSSKSGTKGSEMNYQLTSSSSIKEQRKQQQALLQQQRQQRKLRIHH